MYMRLHEQSRHVSAPEDVDGSRKARVGRDITDADALCVCCYGGTVL